LIRSHKPKSTLNRITTDEQRNIKVLDMLVKIKMKLSGVAFDYLNARKTQHCRTLRLQPLIQNGLLMCWTRIQHDMLTQ
jgi:hypothetical protein